MAAQPLFLGGEIQFWSQAKDATYWIPATTIARSDPHSSRPLAGSQGKLQDQKESWGKAENRLGKTKLLSLLLSPQPTDVLLTEHLHNHHNF